MTARVRRSESRLPSDAEGAWLSVLEGRPSHFTRRFGRAGGRIQSRDQLCTSHACSKDPARSERAWRGNSNREPPVYKTATQIALTCWFAFLKPPDGPFVHHTCNIEVTDCPFASSKCWADPEAGQQDFDPQRSVMRRRMCPSFGPNTARSRTVLQPPRKGYACNRPNLPQLRRTCLLCMWCSIKLSQAWWRTVNGPKGVCCLWPLA